MLPTEETTAAEVYAHALAHGDRPVIHGAEIDYDDVHDGVHYHADLLDAAEKQVAKSLERLVKAQSATKWTAWSVAIGVDITDRDGRDPRTFTSYSADLAKFRAALVEEEAATEALRQANDARDALQAKAVSA